VTRCYLDTSAAAKLLVAEPESESLATWLDEGQVEPVATHLLETELRRFAQRHDLPQAAVTSVLDRVSLHDLPASIFREAGLVAGPTLRSLDALHLVAAIRLGVDVVVTYDARMAEAATSLGLSVGTPA
jgi:predicted nucleic acid-binding protein